MKKIILILSIIFVYIVLTSCSQKAQDTFNYEIQRPVKVIEAQEEVIPIYLEYIGTLMSEETKNISFKSSGRIAQVNVKKGQSIKRGDVLAKLDTIDLEFALSASKAKMQAAKAQYNKAIEGASQQDINKADQNLKKASAAFNFSKETFENVEALFYSDAVSRVDYDKAKLELEVREAEFRQAEEVYNQVVAGSRKEDINTLFSQLEQARVDYEHKISLIEDAEIKADLDGYVLDILFKEGEMVSAGYPVIVIRNNYNVVKTGVSQTDYSKLDMNTKVNVKINGVSHEGIITSIEQIPDIKTRTYNIEISIPQKEYPIGTIVRVEFLIEENIGIKVPISSIMFDGENFVYVVKSDERVVKKNVELGEIIGSSVITQGLVSGDILVVEGMKRLEEGNKVNILN